MRVERDLWLTSPAAILRLNLEDADSAYESMSALRKDHIDMKVLGWVRIGEATIDFEITTPHQEIMVASLGAAKAALAKMDAEHELKRREVESIINKLTSIGWTRS